MQASNMVRHPYLFDDVAVDLISPAGQECYCANKITVSSNPSTGQSVSASDCSMPCSGNSLETCGNGNRIAIYLYTQPLPSGWSVKGCYTDSSSNR
jgi:hypothetical protein